VCHKMAVLCYSEDLSTSRIASQPRAEGRQSTSSGSGRLVTTNYIRSPVSPSAAAASSGTGT